MYKVNNDVFDGIIKSAFNEYVDTMSAEMPSDEELARMFPVPKKALRRVRRKAKELKYRKPLYLVYLQRAAVIVLTCVTLSFGVLMINGEVRAAVTNSFVTASGAVVRWFDKYAEVDFSDTVPNEDQNHAVLSDANSENGSNVTEEMTKKDVEAWELTIGYIPEGFEFDSDASYDFGHMRIFTYQREDGTSFGITIYSGIPDAIASDNEYTTYESVYINGTEAQIFYHNTVSFGTITVKEANYTLYVSGNVTEDDLIKIAENIK